MTTFTIPPSTLHWLAEAPEDRPVVMLIRHLGARAAPARACG